VNHHVPGANFGFHLALRSYRDSVLGHIDGSFELAFHHQVFLSAELSFQRNGAA
jgi:hypothetical protein